MQGSKSVTINGTEYTIRQLPPTKALKLLSKLVRMLGVPFATMMGADKSTLELIMPRAIGELVSRMDDDQVVGLFKELMGAVFAPGNGSATLDGPLFETVFMGKMGDIMELAVEVVRFNYDDFLSVVASAAGAQKPPTASSLPTI